MNKTNGALRQDVNISSKKEAQRSEWRRPKWGEKARFGVLFVPKKEE